MKRPGLTTVTSECSGTSTMYAVHPIFELNLRWISMIMKKYHTFCFVFQYVKRTKLKLWTYLARSLEQVRVTKCGTQTEYVVSFGVLWNRLHDGSINYDQMLGSCFYRASFAGIARIEKQCSALQAYPVALPTTFARQFNLMLLSE